MNDKSKPSADKSAESQIAAKIKSLSNILITVSRDPSVDQLAAALALTLALDKLEKHATAVFSGVIPSVINFLEPEKTFEDNADSLRDFIISLDKQKADRLRFKVEGDIVKVLITPYRTTISESDLSFSEGEFNVELVLAVGVDRKEDLDEAIAAHGRIFHDATVVTLNIDTAKGSLGAINWQDSEASSFSEMVASLVGDLETKDKILLDEQTATALLTGIVAATDQFRNEKTSPTVMTLAANLMGKGANQQLISSELAAAAEGLSLSVGSVDTESGEGSGAGELSLDHVEDSSSDEAARESTDLTLDVDSPTVPDEATTSSDTIDDLVESETKRLAEQRSADALAIAQAQLTEAELADSTRPTIEPLSPPVVDTETPVIDTNSATAEAALDDVVAANNSHAILDDLSTAAPEAPQLSHGTRYVEESINNPLSASVQRDETLAPLPDVMSMSAGHASRIEITPPRTTTPMINTDFSRSAPKLSVPDSTSITMPTLSSDVAPEESAPVDSSNDALSAALLAAQTAETTAGQVTDAQTIAAEAPPLVAPTLDATPVAANMPPLPPANFDLPLPPPPPLPLPDVGTLPPSTSAGPSFDLPPVPVAASLSSEPPVTTPADSGSLFPPVNTVSDDPAQYRIPVQ